jgi:glycosyltransferase involved in cell wall biosynthesis
MAVLGIDARAAAEEPAGRGRVVRELLSALARRDDDHRYLLFTREPWTGQLDERFVWRPLRRRDPWWNLEAAFRAGETDAFLSTNSYLTAWFLRVPSVVVVYDLVAFLPRAAAQRRAARIERATARIGLRRARSIVCISESTRRDLVERYPGVAGKTAVVQLAADPLFAAPRTAAEVEAVRRGLGLTEPFVLFVGTIEPRKNLARALEAFSRLPADVRERHRLAVVGPQGWESEAFVRRAAEDDRVDLLGYVPDEQLAALYQSCELFLYPSLYEGFGLPLLEAMSGGAACITSDRSSLPEIGGDGAVYVDPTSTEAISGALERLLRSPAEREDLSERARAQALRFSWDRTAAELLERLLAVRR